jgi:glutamine synthetase
VPAQTHGVAALTGNHHDPRGDAAELLAFVGTCDLSARFRGRAVPSSRRAELLETGLGWVPANSSIAASGVIAEDDPFGSSGDLRLEADPASSHALPALGDRPAMEVFLGGLHNLDGSAWSCCPRQFLKSAISDLADLGITLRVAFEHEFTIAGFAPQQPFSFAGLRAAEPFGTVLVDTLSAAGMEPETWLPEYGPGQYEITTKPTDGLVAADRAVLLREIVRDVASVHGLSASFAPLLSPDGTGNGVHVHISLYDDAGRALLFDGSRPAGLSELGGAFAAGIVTHGQALSAITAASPSSFLRLKPHRWSAGGRFLADRDREALVRICPTYGPPEAAGRRYNLEYRAGDGTANPWLTLGALLRAGLHGIQAGYVTPPISTPERPLDQVSPMPDSLEQALTELEKDTVARGWFAPELIEAYLTVKRADIAAADGLDDAAVVALVAGQY